MMGIIYEVEALDGWSFESRPGCTKTYPPSDGVIFGDGQGVQSIELDNEDMMLLAYVLNEATRKMRPE